MNRFEILKLMTEFFIQELKLSKGDLETKQKNMRYLYQITDFCLLLDLEEPRGQ